MIRTFSSRTVYRRCGCRWERAMLTRRCHYHRVAAAWHELTWELRELLDWWWDEHRPAPATVTAVAAGIAIVPVAWLLLVVWLLVLPS